MNEIRGMCTELSYDVINENYLRFGINEKQLKQLC